jgi:hypothetical protein
MLRWTCDASRLYQGSASWYERPPPNGLALKLCRNLFMACVGSELFVRSMLMLRTVKQQVTYCEYHKRQISGSSDLDSLVSYSDHS